MVERGKKAVCVNVSSNFGVHKKHGGLELLHTSSERSIISVTNFSRRNSHEQETFFFVCVALLPPCFSYETSAISRKKFKFFLTDVIVTYVCESREGFPRSEKKSEKTGI